MGAHTEHTPSASSVPQDTRALPVGVLAFPGSASPATAPTALPSGPARRSRILPATGIARVLGLPADKVHGIWVPAPTGATMPAMPGSTRPCCQRRWADRCASRGCAMRGMARTPRARPRSTGRAPPSTRMAPWSAMCSRARASRASTSTPTKAIARRPADRPAAEVVAGSVCGRVSVPARRSIKPV
jgi:hypothetical protein